MQKSITGRFILCKCKRVKIVKKKILYLKFWTDRKATEISGTFWKTGVTGVTGPPQQQQQQQQASQQQQHSYVVSSSRVSAASTVVPAASLVAAGKSSLSVAPHNNGHRNVCSR